MRQTSFENLDVDDLHSIFLILRCVMNGRKEGRKYGTPRALYESARTTILLVGASIGIPHETQVVVVFTRTIIAAKWVTKPSSTGLKIITKK